MNKLLRLSGTPLLQTPKRVNGMGPATIPTKEVVSSEHLKNLAAQLKEILQKWKGCDLFEGKLVDVVHTKVVAKSNRLSYLFGKEAEKQIRGARYKAPEQLKEKTQHIITYYLTEKTLNRAAVSLLQTAEALDEAFEGSISGEEMNTVLTGSLTKISVSKFRAVVKDSFYIESFSFPSPGEIDFKTPQVINFYRTEQSTASILERSGIDTRRLEKLDDFTYIAAPEELQTLVEKVPFLISMSCSDFSRLELEDVEEDCEADLFRKPIPEPLFEPEIGVLDTQFDERVYFSKWVKYKNLIDKNILPTSSYEEFEHGTQVTSLIVDGPSLNPELDDGCGRFRVRHFAVAPKGVGSGVTILRNILKAVEENPEIKVWNLSLGSRTQISQNTISYIAAELDRLQANRKDLVFVVAATNKPPRILGDMFIGSPADSINSIVVNSCTRTGSVTDYSRHGPVLSFFTKPDICTFGGEKKDPLKTSGLYSECNNYGTSFAAPWIARKMAYLMHMIGLSREEAKALLIDSALRWERSAVPDSHLGFGRVPVKIDDILSVKNNEIKFFVSGLLTENQIQTHTIPVPVINDKFPYLSRAVLAYFPKCNRMMGVDYTETELDLHFGRVVRTKVKNKPDRISIETVNDNHQGDPGKLNLGEGKVRDKFRKWDNVKVISELLTGGNRSKKTAEGNYGLKIMRIERRNVDAGAIPFAALITLKNLNGANVISSFIKNCQVVGWMVQQIDVQASVRFFEEAEEEVEFDS